MTIEMRKDDNNMKAAIIKRVYEHRRATKNYILRDSNGNTWTADRYELKEQIKNNELTVVNLKLLSNNRLILTSPNKVYNFPEELNELNMFVFDNIKIDIIRYDSIQCIDNKGKINNLYVSLRTDIGTRLDIEFNKLEYTLGVDNCCYGVCFEYENINEIIKKYITDNIGTDKIRNVRVFFNELLKTTKIVKVDEKKVEIDKPKVIEEIKIKVELHNCRYKWYKREYP